MPSIAIENFKFGKDTRKSELSSNPGSLVSCINGHINQGGEIEKRRAFKLAIDCRVNDETGSLGVFGLEVTNVGLAVFGSAYVFGTAFQTHVLASALPASVTYVQLVHPASVGVTYNSAIHRMTALVCSTSFGGKTWAVARFADSSVYAYYDGSVIAEMVDGKILVGKTGPNVIANQLADVLRRLLPDYTVDYSSQDFVLLYPPVSDPDFTIATSDSSPVANLSSKPIAAVPATPGQGAYTVFQVTNAGTAADSITRITAPDGGGGVGVIELLSNPITGGGTVANMAQLIAQEINRTPSGYTASVETDTVTVHAPVGYGEAANTGGSVPPLTFTFTDTGGLSFNASGTPAMVVVTNHSSVWNSSFGTGTRVMTTNMPAGGSVTGTASGGTGTYTSYTWQINDGGTWRDCLSTDPLHPTIINGPMTKFTGSVPLDSSLGGLFRLKVVDSGATTVYSDNVYAALYNNKKEIL